MAAFTSSTEPPIDQNQVLAAVGAAVGCRVGAFVGGLGAVGALVGPVLGAWDGKLVGAVKERRCKNKSFI